jgi:spore maturation protein CgeB
VSKTQKLRILIPKPGGVALPYVVEDSKETFEEFGHEVRIINFDKKGSEYVEIIKREIRNFRPDFFFTIDHIGVIPSLFNKVKLPYLSWFIDNPFYFLKRKDPSPYCFLFIWDKAYVQPIKEWGFKNVFYLPQASNPRIFKKINLTREDLENFGCDVSFAGSSMYSRKARYCEQIKNPFIKAVFEQVVKILAENPSLDLSSVFEEVSNLYNCRISFKGDYEWLIKSRIEFSAMAKYRKEILEELKEFNLRVYGDSGWRDLLDEKIPFLGRIDNREELPKLYNATKINLNITRTQQRTSPPMRVFDICGCGAFLLTDYRRELSNLFELGDEIICYKDKYDLKNKIEYFLRRPHEREKIAKKAQKRVLKQHTYKVRLTQMFRQIQNGT